MDPGTIALILVLILYGGGALALRRQSRLRQGLLEDHTAQIKRLRKEREILRLTSEMEDMHEWAALRPMRTEAIRARLGGRADKRLLDWAVNRKALEQLLGQGPRTIDGDPIRTARSAVREAIEIKQADGDDSESLEQVLKILEAEY